ncbi:MAG: tandem-95 repeat protein [Candidatus Eisenbacteria bacterium]|uniref:Tandem-95 repeat protein n=1 Tax=Eiseniibacteriota bacterium TaxID=2212470 RepID=A0A538SS49_UNCEI|nr:MAG: tandem-95 repeat protein [Candidatus Eisenbacteria bacterium]
MTQPNRSISRGKVFAPVALAGLVLAGSVARVGSANASAGYRDFNFGSTVSNTPTGEKPESKLWWNDGSWWGSLWDPGTNRHTIQRFDTATQSWTSTGTAIDPRSSSRGDALWDGTHLYVVSHIFTTSGGSTTSSNAGRLYRYSYNPGSRTYSLDSGFPVNVNLSKSETLVIDKDSTGRLWVTWTEGGKVKVNRTVGSDLAWGQPYDLPVQGNSVTSDDISSIATFGSGRIGLMWSNQNDKKMYFAVHLDGNPDTQWEPREDAVADKSLGAVADDHINLKMSCDGSGALYTVTKTSLDNSSDPLIFVSKRDASGTWSRHVFGTHSDNHTRPILLIDGNAGVAYVFAMSDHGGRQIIYVKSASLADLNFPTGLGTPFIDSSSDGMVNNPTSTKQCLSGTTGLLVLASDQNTHYYLHNYLSLGPAAPFIASFSPSSGIVGSEITLTGSHFTGATAVAFNGTAASTFTIDSDTQIQATVPSGAATGPISVSGPGGNGLSAASFVVITAPAIASFGPSSGATGTQVTISGTGFAGTTSVTFGGVSSQYTVDSNAQIRATVPSGAVTGRIEVTNPAGAIQSAQDFTVTPPPPVVDSFQPSSGVASTEVTLTGSYLTGANAVAFNGTPAATFTVDSDNQLRAVVPSGATTGSIRVTTPYGTASSATSFTVFTPPSIASFTPSNGLAGTQVTLSGSGFIGTSDVTFGGVSSQYTVDNDSRIRATVPPGAATGRIVVTNPAGIAQSAQDFVVPLSLTFAAAADAYVSSSKTNNNFGTATHLRARQSGTSYKSYLRFVVSGISGTVLSAKLRLYAADGSSDAGSFYAVSNNYLGTPNPWTETGITWNNGPSLSGTPLATAGSVAVGTWAELDVTTSIAGDGTYCYGVLNHSSDQVTYNSKEASSNPPQLVLLVQQGSSSQNTPPVANADSYSTDEDVALTVPAPGVLGNDNDPDGDPLGVSGSSLPAHGTLGMAANGGFTYTPQANYNGSDSFTYAIGDGRGSTATATVSLTINPVNDPPVAHPDSWSATAGQTLTVAAPGVLANDVDVDGDPMSAVLVTDVSHGTLALNANGSFTYTPAAGFTGTDSFTCGTTDGLAVSAVASVALPVGGGAGGGPVVFEEVQSGGSTGVATVSTSNSLAAVSGELYLAAVACKSSTAVTAVSGLGLTWTRVRSQCGGRAQTSVEVWVGSGTPTAGTVTATLQKAATNAVIMVARYSGADPTSPLGNSLSGNPLGLSGPCSGGVDNTTFAFNLPTASGSLVFGAVASRSHPLTPGAGYVKRGQVFQGVDSGTMASVSVVDKAALGDTTLFDGTFDSTTDWAVAAVEIRRASLAAQSVTSDATASSTGMPDDLLPLSFRIFPNPFGGAGTWIEYALPSDQWVEASVFNVQGRRVRTLASGHQAAGKQRLYWDGRNDRGTDSGPGVYFLRTRVGSALRTYRVVMRR